MKDTTKEADLILANLMNFTTPRRPKRWGKILQAYRDLDPDDRDAITKEQVQGLIDWFAPGAKKKRSQNEKKAKAHQKAAKAKARETRNLPQNRNQTWNLAEKGYKDSSGINVRGRKPKNFTDSQYDPERVYIRLLKKMDQGEKDVFLKEFARQIASDIRETRMKSSLAIAEMTQSDTPPTNNPEFSESYQFGYIPPPGSKLSGDTRRLLGERDDGELDKATLKGASEEFKGLWAKDQAEVKEREAKERKEWRESIGGA